MAKAHHDISPCPECSRLVRKPAELVTPSMKIFCGHCGVRLVYFIEEHTNTWGWGVLEND